MKIHARGTAFEHQVGLRSPMYSIAQTVRLRREKLNPSRLSWLNCVRRTAPPGVERRPGQVPFRRVRALPNTLQRALSQECRLFSAVELASVSA
jgi:hypothetical protein